MTRRVARGARGGLRPRLQPEGPTSSASFNAKLRRGYFRFVPIQLAEGRPLAEQLGIDPDRPDSFAFVANGQAYVKSEAALRTSTLSHG